MAVQQLAQGVVGGVRRCAACATRTSQACADRAYLVPAGLRRSGGAWPVRVSCLSADWTKVWSGILPASGPGEPPGPVSASQWLPLSVRSGDAGRVARPVAQAVFAVLILTTAMAASFGSVPTGVAVTHQ